MLACARAEIMYWYLGPGICLGMLLDLLSLLSCCSRHKPSCVYAFGFARCHMFWVLSDAKTSQHLNTHPVERERERFEGCAASSGAVDLLADMQHPAETN